MDLQISLITNCLPPNLQQISFITHFNRQYGNSQKIYFLRQKIFKNPQNINVHAVFIFGRNLSKEI